MSLANQIYNFASVSAYVRAQTVNPSLAQNIMQQLSMALGGHASDGTYTYNLCQANTGLAQTNGFGDGGYWDTLEQNIAVFEGNVSSKIGIASLIYAYSVFSNVNPNYGATYINKFNNGIYAPYSPGHSFTYSDVVGLINGFSLSGVSAQVATSSGQAVEKSVNYNWYDSTPLFQSFSATSAYSQLVKDVESQYYYLSGELIYSGFYQSLPNCIQDTATVVTPTGAIQILVYRRTPCFDQNSYVGPVTGVKFFREFSDGPATSGYFDQTVEGDYVNFDKAVLQVNDYSSNLNDIYSYQTGADGNYIYLNSGVQTDVPGVFSPSLEYGAGHTNYMQVLSGCSSSPSEYSSGYYVWSGYTGTGLPLMRMHQGDEFKKWYFYKHCTQTDSNGNCVQCGWTGYQTNSTGWKFAGLELKNDWLPKLAGAQANPYVDTGRILKRALNLNNSTDGGGNPITPYYNVIDTGDGVLTCNQALPIYPADPIPYVGPPQLNGVSSLPGFAFYQSFDNHNFGTGISGDLAKIIMRPAISISNGGKLGGDSVRSLSLSNFNIVTGIKAAHDTLTSPAKIGFSVTLPSSGMTQYDQVFKQCFAMGDNFGNRASVTSTPQANAGFLYTGHYYTIGGVPTTEAALLSSYSGNQLGAQYSHLRYVTGYKRISDGRTFFITPQVGQIITGDTSNGVSSAGTRIEYQYFANNSGLGAQNYGWNSIFAQLPSDVLANNYNYSGIYGYQMVENYLPRYASGAFASYKTNFLYPNAQNAFGTYNSRVKGFPVSVDYVINVKEETVREIFVQSGLAGTLNYQNIVRAGPSNTLTGLRTEMVLPFTSTDSYYRNTYSLNKNPSLYPTVGVFSYKSSIPSCVNAFYVPTLTACNQSNLNSTVYNNAPNNSFQNGIRYTGIIVDRTVVTGKSGAAITVQNYSPRSEGALWGYNGIQLSGTMNYCFPAFDLSTLSLTPDSNLVDSIARFGIDYDAPTFSNNGYIRNQGLFDANGYNGRDPIFYEYMGGRSGSGANLEGGYHSKGLIGDSWYDFNLLNLGSKVVACGESTFSVRAANNDRDLFVLSLTTSGLDIFTRGLLYNPYYLTGRYNPYVASSLNIGVGTASGLRVGAAEYYYGFNLKGIMPLISISGTGFYNASGFNVGPFDRDVELCVLSGNKLLPSGALVIDGETICDSGWSLGGCPINYTEYFYENSGIIPGQAGRNAAITTFKLIPSGASSNINISGVGKIGFAKDAIITIRPRTTFGAVDYAGSTTSLPFSGDATILNEFNYVNNGSEQKYSIPYNGNFNNLLGQTLEFSTAPKIDILYPVPGDDFDSVLSSIGVLSYDSLGNKTYKSQKGPTHDYWQKRNPGLYATGFREVSRINFQIVSVNTNYGQIPFASYMTVIPSGQCTISGVFGYTGEAESAVISEGILLSGATGSGLCASSLKSIVQPVYLSDVLKRLPSWIQTLPSGSGIYPVLDAPSYMMERLNPFVITGGDIYVGASPDPSLNYNKFLWPALSDLATLNPELVYETLPPDDGSVFSNSNLIFSASQGQILSSGVSGLMNPSENVTYNVLYEYAFLDSAATNALYNTGKCLIKTNGASSTLTSGNLTGIISAQGIPIAINLTI